MDNRVKNWTYQKRLYWYEIEKKNLRLRKLSCKDYDSELKKIIEKFGI